MRIFPVILFAAFGAPSVLCQVPALADLRPRLPAGLGDGTHCAMVDLNGDGLADLLRAEGSRLRVLVQTPQGDFFERPLQPVIDFGATGPITALAFGHLDPDPDFDVVVGLAAGADQVLDNDGTGLLTRVVPAPIPPGPFPATGIVIAADFDGRAGDDLLVLAANAPPRLLYGGATTGFGFFDATGLLPQSASVTRSTAAVADLDLDGDLDIVLAGGALAPPIVLLNDGAGDFRLGGLSLGVAVPIARSLQIVDVTRDGRPDLVFAPAGGGMLSPTVLRGGPGPSFALLPPAGFVALGYADLQVADIDRDGVPELLVLQDDGQILIGSGPGDGTFPRAMEVGKPARRSALALGDVEGDGDLDLWSAGIAVEDELWLGGAAGGLVATESSTAPIGAHRSGSALAVVDASGDLDPDLVMVGRDGRIVVWRNDGGGRFAESPGANIPSLPSGGAYSILRAMRLVGGGLARDLVVLGQPTPAHPAGVRVLERRVTGYVDVSGQLFVQPQTGRLLTALRAVPLGVGAVADGRSDLLVGDAAGSVLAFRSVGGVFGELPAAVTTVHQGAVLDILVADLDGDAAPDLVVIPSSGPPVVQMAAGPNGLAFRALPGAIPIAMAASAGWLADLTGDGIPDLMLATLGVGSDLTLLGGRGDGGFVDLSARWLAAIPSVGPVTALARNGDDRLVIARDGVEDVVLVRRSNGFVVEGAVPCRGSRASVDLVAADLDLDGDDDLVVVRSDAEPCVLAGARIQFTARGVGQIGRPLRLRMAGPNGASAFLLFSPLTARVPLPGLGVLRLISPASLVAVPLNGGVAVLDVGVPSTLSPLELPLQMVLLDPGASSITIGNLERVPLTDH